MTSRTEQVLSIQRFFSPPIAPDIFYNRNTLWNAVEKAEKRVDSRTAREVEIALPNELTLDEQIKLVREYVDSNFINQGMCADVAIHSGRHSDNPHAHILLTTRTVGPDGFSAKKNRDWDKSNTVSLWRKEWAKAQNLEYERKGLETRVSHESYAKQGIDHEPTIHIGHAAMEIERRGIPTDRGNQNRAIKAINKEKEDKEIQQRDWEQNPDHWRTYEMSR